MRAVWKTCSRSYSARVDVANPGLLPRSDLRLKFDMTGIGLGMVIVGAGQTGWMFDNSSCYYSAFGLLLSSENCQLRVRSGTEPNAYDWRHLRMSAGLITRMEIEWFPVSRNLVMHASKLNCLNLEDDLRF